jgi:phosphoenolpyruvate carboxylase
VIAGQGRYLSLLMPQGLYAVFKVVKRSDTLELHALSADDDIKKADLNKYFDKIEKVNRDDEEYYKVTIVDKKLEPYFKSTIPSKEITKLVLVR